MDRRDPSKEVHVVDGAGAPEMDFVTVVYELEQPLLALQARSMAQYLPREVAGRLVIIDNSCPRMRRSAISRLLANYGPLAPSVEVVTPKQLGISCDTWGDRGQQLLKLMVASHLRRERYVVLDAKNHLIAPLDLSWLYARDGRPRTRVHSYIGHPREHGLRLVLAHFGLDNSLVDGFPASTTPFTLRTSVVRALMRHLEEQTQNDFATAFMATDMTEFPLYVGWLLSKCGRLESHFAVDDVVVPTIWPHLADRDRTREMIALAGATTPFFSAHRQALVTMDPGGVDAIARFWAGRGLVVDDEAGRALIASFRHQYARATLRRRLHRAPFKFLELIRRKS